MLDFEHLVAIAISRGMTQKRFASLIGISPGHLRRLMSGNSRPNERVVTRALHLLNLRESDICTSAEGEWVRFPKTGLHLLTEFHEQFQNAESMLTVTSSVESYLQDEWMLDWSNRVWLGIRDWDQHSQVLYPYARQQKVAREHSNFLQRIVCPWHIFVAAKVQNVEWLDQIRRGLGAFEGMTAVMPVCNWRLVYAQCNSLLPSEAAGWDKICIVDSIRALIHVQQDWYLSCSNERVVRNLKRAVDDILSKACSDFLRESQVQRTSLMSAAHRTEDGIERILRSKEDLERAQPNFEAFARLIRENTYVPPLRFVERRARLPVKGESLI